MNGPKMIHFIATKLYPYFSGNPQSNGWSLIFAGSKTLQKVMEIHILTCSKYHSYTQIRLPYEDPKSYKNNAKIQLKSPQNKNTKYAIRYCNGQKRTPSLDLRKRIKTRSFVSFPVLLCSHHGCKNR